eukprot:6046836-Pleurochrysis_carterae.AAC.1
MVHGNAFDMVERMGKYLVFFRQHHDLAKWQDNDWQLLKKDFPTAPLSAFKTSRKTSITGCVTSRSQ